MRESAAQAQHVSSTEVGRLNTEFRSYLGQSQIRDGTILAVDADTPGGVTVRIRGGDGREIQLAFDDVRAVRQHRAVGMMVYAMAELAPSCAARRFAFVNMDEDDDATLEIDALQVRDESPTAAM
jgi:hypothetical protein